MGTVMLLKGKCVACEKEFNWNPDEKDVKPGDVYSYSGIKETKITGLCECCFDDATKEENN